MLSLFFVERSKKYASQQNRPLEQNNHYNKIDFEYANIIGAAVLLFSKKLPTEFEFDNNNGHCVKNGFHIYHFSARIHKERKECILTNDKSGVQSRKVPNIKKQKSHPKFSPENQNLQNIKQDDKKDITLVWLLEISDSDVFRLV